MFEKILDHRLKNFFPFIILREYIQNNVNLFFINYHSSLKIIGICNIRATILAVNKK